LEVKRQQILAQQAKRLTVQMQRDQQARRIEEVCGTLRFSDGVCCLCCFVFVVVIFLLLLTNLMSLQDRKRYEAELKLLQEQQQLAQEEAEHLRREVQEQKRLWLLAEKHKQAHMSLQRSVETLDSTLGRSSSQDAIYRDLQPFFCRRDELQFAEKLAIGSVGVTSRGVFKSRQVRPPLHFRKPYVAH